MDKSDDPGDFTLPTPIPYFHSAKPALPGVREVSACAIVFAGPPG